MAASMTVRNESGVEIARRRFCVFYIVFARSAAALSAVCAIP
ncbi:hypothetical protein [Sphingopyxis microcysteis]|nr:hypothetical protein [Sphingopyxis microcysteis]